MVFLYQMKVANTQMSRAMVKQFIHLESYDFGCHHQLLPVFVLVTRKATALHLLCWRSALVGCVQVMSTAGPGVSRFLVTCASPNGNMDSQRFMRRGNALQPAVNIRGCMAVNTAVLSAIFSFHVSCRCRRRAAGPPGYVRR